MTFDELSAGLYDDLNGSITCVEVLPDDTYSISLACDDWGIGQRRRSFRLLFEGVVEARFELGYCGEISQCADHVLLWRYNHPHESVYFSGISGDPFSILGRIQETHGKIMGSWRSMSEYWHANAETLAVGFGSLFAAPTLLANHYCDRLEGLVSYSRVPTHTPSGGYSAFLFDDDFIIAKTVSVIEVGTDHRRS